METSVMFAKLGCRTKRFFLGLQYHPKAEFTATYSIPSGNLQFFSNLPDDAIWGLLPMINTRVDNG
jgi:hypothetical protein